MFFNYGQLFMNMSNYSLFSTQVLELVAQIPTHEILNEMNYMEIRRGQPLAKLIGKLPWQS